ncbi:transposon Ty3-I Gag-Pol polyprotein [Trichonephila clavipes]|nr:transposon Ty3-I Gag-Pol polyprotein [Trichonephila clavipes]
MLPFCPNDFDDNNITKIAARAEESRQLARVHTLRAQDKDRRRYDSKHQMVSYAPGDLVLRRLSAVTYAVQDFDPASRKRKLREVVHVLRMKPYHDPAEQIETEDIPPKESYKGPITRSRIKTLEQTELAERWTELPQVSEDELFHLQWVPSHVGLPGNEVANDLAKVATSDPMDPEDHMVLKLSKIYSRAKPGNLGCPSCTPMVLSKIPWIRHIIQEFLIISDGILAIFDWSSEEHEF